MSGKPEKGFIAEYAKSGRAGCKSCGSNIEKGALRLGKYVQSPHFDGYIPLWSHLDCYFRKAAPGIDSTMDISGFAELSFDDQKKIKGLLSGDVKVEPAKGGKKGGGGDDGPGDVGDYSVEYAKSNRSKCKACDEKIETNEVRMGPIEKMDRPPFLPAPKWHHLDCLEKAGKHGGLDVTKVKGFGNLKKEDQEIVKKKFGGAEGGAAAGAKRAAKDEPPAAKGKGKKVKKEEEEAAAAPAKLSKEEQAMKNHSEKLWAIRNKLKEVSTSDLKFILDHNGVSSKGGDVVLQARTADIMLHGVPGACPKCDGRLKYEDGQYSCTAWADEYARCQYKSVTADRVAFKMPKDVEDDDYLGSFKFVKTAIPRALTREQEKAEEFVKDKAAKERAAANEEAGRVKEETKSDPTTALAGLVFAIHQNKGNPIDKEQLKDKIEGAGGALAGSVSAKVTHVVTTKGACESGGKPIADAVKKKLPVVLLGFIDACISDGRKVSEQPFLLKGEATEEPGAKRKGNEQPKTMKIMVKGKGAVDVDSGLADDSHVLQKGSEVFSATLNRTDLASGMNSYYVLQVIESDTGKSFYVYRKWGRIGTEVKNDKLEGMDKQSAIREFMKIFEEKTGNPWSHRDPDNFEQIPGKFAIMELGLAEVSEPEEKKQKKGKKVASTLPNEVASLVELIFDVEVMKKSMMEMEIDLDKMPLGQLSRKQIQRGYDVLTEIQDILQDESLDAFDRKQQILGKSNKFYTIVPQNFGSGGMSDIHLIDDAEKLKSKIEMVESLLELEIAVSMSKQESTTEESVLDTNYKKLNTDLKPIKKGSDTWKMIEEYIKNTHAKTHSHYSLKLVDAFDCAREGEDKRFKKFEKNHNRQLLWHGSRITNWVGILSQGLRIAPPEAPVTGYMFGKGVYFADMVSKSANYCFASASNPEGLLLLSEVALGDLHELNAANSSLPKGIPKDKLSVKGYGKTAPDPGGSRTMDDGVVVPMGKSTETFAKKTSLLYNEFIVYDTAQIKARYLMRVKFEYGSGRRY
mmetsp:Transcript_9337/g.22090  ORF Transcript_9337/g.22090 Transcript_9337/m.22090 type:complete len:1025 (-) Transcript_9337:206-3280(-)